MLKKLYKLSAPIFVALSLLSLTTTILLNAGIKNVTASSSTNVDLKIHRVGMGVVTPIEGTHSYSEGVTVTLSAQPLNEYWTFEGWSGDLNGGTAIFPLVMDADKTITATFKHRPTHTLNLNIVGDGRVIFDPVSEQGANNYTFLENALITMTAVASNGARFLAWSGDISGSMSTQQIEMNADKTITATFEAQSYTVYLPLILKNYMPFANHDFQSGTLRGWEQLQGPFDGHGTGLAQGVVNDAAQLGNPAYIHKSIPVGYGAIAQTFTVKKRYLSFDYDITTSDVVKIEATQRYYDTFEVSLFTPPPQVTDDNRNDKCSETNLNPNGTIIVKATDALLFCGGRYGTSSVVGTPQSYSGAVVLDLGDFVGQNITLYFTNWSREYGSPDWNDNGWYNTWVTLDNFVESD